MTNVEGKSTQMHRSVTSRDVTEYSTGAAPKSINLNREEDIEYQARTLQHSSGFINISIAKPRRRGSETDEDTFNLDISANGSYSLDLVYCNNPTTAGDRETRSARLRTMTRGTLAATVDKRKLLIACRNG